MTRNTKADKLFNQAERWRDEGKALWMAALTRDYALAYNRGWGDICTSSVMTL